MQAMTAHVNQLSRRREPPAMAAAGDRLIEGADREERDDNSKNSHSPPGYERNATSSEFIRSACVQSTPWGPPGSSTNLTFLIILACLLEVASGGRILSASPCRMRVGTSFLAMSLRKSSIQQSTHITVPMAEAPTPMFQLSSSARSLTSFPPVTS